jgi:hypothetical protein
MSGSASAIFDDLVEERAAIASVSFAPYSSADGCNANHMRDVWNVCAFTRLCAMCARGVVRAVAFW